jgi:hypothetical protein
MTFTPSCTQLLYLQYKPWVGNIVFLRGALLLGYYHPKASYEAVDDNIHSELNPARGERTEQGNLAPTLDNQ